MIRSTPQHWLLIRRSLRFLSLATLVLLSGSVRAQQNAVHVWHPVGTAGVHPAPVPVSPVRPTTFAPAPHAGTAVRRLILPVGQGRMIVVPPMASARVPLFDGSAWPAGSFYFFGAQFFAPTDGLPLGFGLWPACDSSGTPGVFSSVGPCFGIGDYSGELSPAPSALGAASPTTYLLPVFFPEEAAAAPAQPSPSTPAAPPVMILYRTDGNTLTVSDWWVAGGRLDYVTEAGVNGSMDLSELDLEQTIKQNQTRGHDFFLKFTPPSNLYPPSERP